MVSWSRASTNRAKKLRFFADLLHLPRCGSSKRPLSIMLHIAMARRIASHQSCSLYDKYAAPQARFAAQASATRGHSACADGPFQLRVHWQHGRNHGASQACPAASVLTPAASVFTLFLACDPHETLYVPMLNQGKKGLKRQVPTHCAFTAPTDAVGMSPTRNTVVTKVNDMCSVREQHFGGYNEVLSCLCLGFRRASRDLFGVQGSPNPKP